MRNTIIRFMIVTCSLAAPQLAPGYLMAMQTYEAMFERADVVVIATPMATRKSKTDLEFDQPETVSKLIKTIDTKFKVAFVLKGKMEGATFHFLHLSRKDGKSMVPGPFGAVGTFFVDFETEANKRKSFILFMKKREDGTYCPAWNPMEGSRAIIAVPKDGEL